MRGRRRTVMVRVRLKPEEVDEFRKLCRDEGYIQGAVIGALIERWMFRQRAETVSA